MNQGNLILEVLGIDVDRGFSADTESRLLTLILANNSRNDFIKAIDPDDEDLELV